MPGIYQKAHKEYSCAYAPMKPPVDQDLPPARLSKHPPPQVGYGAEEPVSFKEALNKIL